MFTKLGVFLAGLVVAGLAFVSTGDAANAAPPPPAFPDGPATAAPAPNVLDGRDHIWLRVSIIEAAADTIGVPVRVVYEGLDHGLSLDDIAYLNGVHEDALERGIIRDIRADLAWLVRHDKITPRHAEDVLEWVVNHIDRIVRHHGHFDDELNAA